MLTSLVPQAAHAAFAQDVSAGHARPQPSIASTSAPARKAAAKPSNPFTNYSTAESLGYKDPDAERAEAEAERRRTQGVVGEWQVITPTPTPPAPQLTEDEPSDSTTISSGVPAKRELDAHSDDEYDRHSKLRKKTVSAGLGEIYDPGIITIKLKKKEEPTGGPKAGMGDDASSSSVVKQEDEKPTGPQKWVKVQWNQIPEESLVGGKPFLNVTEPQSQDEVASPVHGDQLVKAELEHAAVKTEEMVKSEEPLETAPQTVGGSLFKKRRTPASVATNRGRRNI